MYSSLSQRVLALCGTALCTGALGSPLQDALDTSGGDQAVPDPISVALLLEERCVRCHGTESTDKKAIKDWPDALDLVGTLAIPDMVVAGDAEGSDLFLTCDDGDMPPEDEIEEPLNPRELALLARWITDGAQLPDPAALKAHRAALAAAGNGPPVPPPGQHHGAKSWWAFIGRLHITLLHFPIALLVLAGVLALKPGAPTPLLRTCLGTAAPFACLASISGWILAQDMAGDVDLHRWLGVACAVLSLLTLLVTVKSWRFWRPLVFITCIVLIAAAHGGGDLVHGEDWLRLPL